MSESIQPDVTVDSRGATCPGPLMDLIGKVKKLEPGTVVELLTTDSSSSHDVPEWVDKAGHETLDVVEHEDEGYWSVFIETTK
ncbi:MULTISPECIES: sulfurtransferase TusA family protein [Haloferax]|uniref:Sulfurtransferase TusA family protein n=2 Tax=Haloferax TaxID=2251 RepID=A0A6A8GBF2_9EURY|nr:MULTISPECIES: sulfurtransferase TusA family protein [Haloferax]KAB1192086.1 sulfurtransferase TusA family protein [Haloferax sp. CBA1148]KTG21929.1 SirA family protein [Haloferax profundi]MRX20533.1 sulfurtransferase TusA family protein [Haloferax litoreum]